MLALIPEDAEHVASGTQPSEMPVPVQKVPEGQLQSALGIVDRYMRARTPYPYQAGPTVHMLLLGVGANISKD